jgi:hypothetical protein
MYTDLNCPLLRLLDSAEILTQNAKFSFELIQRFAVWDTCRQSEDIKSSILIISSHRVAALSDRQVISKSVPPSWIRQNIELEFDLSDDQVGRIRQMNRGFRFINGVDEFGEDSLGLGLGY